MASEFNMIAALRGCIPETCDFCQEPFTEVIYPTPEEGGAWACIECVRRWDEQQPQLGDKP